MDTHAIEKTSHAPINLDRTDRIVEEAARRATDLLRDCVAPFGFSASGSNGGYKQIWGRDSMITSFGVLLTNEKELIETVRKSLVTLREHQTARGLIPNKIDFDPKRVNFRAYADGGLLFTIVGCSYVKHTNDLAFGRNIYASLESALEWYRYQDVDQSGLISTQEGSDWKDLFCQRGKTLYVNTLFHMALTSCADLAESLSRSEEAASLRQEAETLKERIRSRFWYKPNKPIAEIIQDSFSTSSYNEEGYDKLGRKLLLPKKTVLVNDAYFLPYVTLRHFGEWFDTLGNLLAILSEVANTYQADLILDFIAKYEIAGPYPARALYPAQTPKDPDWRDYYRFGDLNRPDHYHNGGIWPMIGGFYIAALYKRGRIDEARRALEKLAEANRIGSETPWEFREYLHGKISKPEGMRDQAWNAGSYLMAYNLLRKKE